MKSKTRLDFISSYLPLARKAGESFRINPVVILAQAVIESGWGQSDLAREHHNFFGITAYGKKNVWWKGEGIELGAHSLRFRVYDTPQDSFMDYARLIRHAYTPAADVSNNPQLSPVPSHTAVTSAKSTATTAKPTASC